MRQSVVSISATILLLQLDNNPIHYLIKFFNEFIGWLL